MHAESSEVRQLNNENGKLAITSKNEKENYIYLALFNTSDKENLDVEVKLETLGLIEEVKITNMWTGEEVGCLKIYLDKTYYLMRLDCIKLN